MQLFLCHLNQPYTGPSWPTRLPPLLLNSLPAFAVSARPEGARRRTHTVRLRRIVDRRVRASGSRGTRTRRPQSPEVARKFARLDENLGALQVELAFDEMNALEAASEKITIAGLDTQHSTSGW